MAKRDLRPIGIDDLEQLQIDGKRQLYWNGERIRSQITLTWFQTFAAIVAVTAGFATVATGLNNASNFVCSRGWSFPIGGCPVQPAGPAAPPPVTPAKAP